MLYLLNVPQWTTTMPPVALTCLTGYMENRNIKCTQIDINIKFYNYIFKQSFYNKIAKSLRKDTRKLIGGKSVDYNEYLASNIQDAISVLKNGKEILSKEKREWSNRIVTDYLKVLNQYLSPVYLSLNSMTFGLEDCVTYSQVFKSVSNIDKYHKLLSIYSEIIKEIDFEENSLIGFSINNMSQLINAYFIVKLIKKKVKAHFFIGGSYISANQDTIINCGRIFEVFDSLCLYDGEHAIENLYNYFYYGEELFVKNILLKKQKLLDKKQYYIENVQELPAPSYKNIDFKDYLSPIRMISIPVSRGCYGNCAFCSYNHLASSKWREQDIEQIISQIKECKEKYSCKYFFFSVATMSPSMAKKISKRIIEEQIDVYWASGIRMEKTFDEMTISLMAKAGCVRLDIGIESASQKVLDSMNKRVDEKCFREIIKNMYKYGILPYLYIIKNFPTEGVDDWKLTLNFLDDVSDNILGFSCYDYFLSPNTSVYENPDVFGVDIVLKKEYKDIIERVQSFSTKFISDSDKKMKDVMLNDFYRKKKNKFVKYGNAYLDRKMPLTLPNQMYYKTMPLIQEQSIQIEKNRVYTINGEGAILLDDDGKYMKIYALKTGHTIMIRSEILKEMNGKTINSTKIKDNKEKYIEICKNLLMEGIIK